MRRILFGTAALLLCAPVFGAEQNETGPAVGTTAPDIDGRDIFNKKFKLSDYRGKVVVLDFWGNW